MTKKLIVLIGLFHLMLSAAVFAGQGPHVMSPEEVAGQKLLKDIQINRVFTGMTKKSVKASYIMEASEKARTVWLRIWTASETWYDLNVKLNPNRTIKSAKVKLVPNQLKPSANWRAGTVSALVMLGTAYWATDSNASEGKDVKSSSKTEKVFQELIGTGVPGKPTVEGFLDPQLWGMPAK